MRYTIILWALLSAMVAFPAAGQHLYRVRATAAPNPPITGGLRMGDPGPAPRRLEVNSQYLTIGARPVLPVMGEVHFSRLPRAAWSDVLLKMKANGVTIISTYVFWIYHEPMEGQFRWSGNRDLRYFLELCARYGLMAIVRIGPWCHGEVRNGGTPDWLVKKKYLRDRSNDPLYQHYVQLWYEEVSRQLTGLLYKDSGPVIGVQLENEYRRGKAGEAHIAWLKQTARQAGIDVPLYTVTGWGDASIPAGEVLPLFGGYPGAPWNTDLKPITDNDSYLFSTVRNDQGIGNEMNLKVTRDGKSYFRYPYLTCELGIANEDTYHRRPVFSAIDGLAIATAKLGSGSNLIGYYMFAGGTNATSPFTSLEENQDETGYWNRYPKRSYDFQAAIRESGELSGAYFSLKKLHYFVCEYGSKLAPMQAFPGDRGNPHRDLQYAVRATRDTGFLFGLNYYRGDKKPVQRQAQFSVTLPDEEMTFPSVPVDIADSAVFIWPFNFTMGPCLLKYATASPLCRMVTGDTTSWFFTQTRGITPEFCFDSTAIGGLTAVGAQVKKTSRRYLVMAIQPGISHPIEIRGSDGRLQRIFVLDPRETHNAWLLHWHGGKILALSKAGLYINQDSLQITSGDPTIRITYLSDRIKLSGSGASTGGSSQAFHTTTLTLPARKPALRIHPVDVLGKAKWLAASVTQTSRVNTLWHRYFIREVNLKNTASIESATFYLATGVPCRIRVNGRWVNQSVRAGVLNKVDMTGYLTEGGNTLMMAFPYAEQQAAFAAKLEVTYRNTERTELVTDSAWLTTEAYIPPAPWERFSGLTPAATVPAAFTPVDTSGVGSWQLTIEDKSPQALRDDYLYLRYDGDRATLRLGNELINDDFNNRTTWHLALGRYRDRLAAGPLLLTIYPLKPGYRIYFDRQPGPPPLNTARITGAVVVPAYKTRLAIKMR